jgi:hypothetical protein
MSSTEAVAGYTGSVSVHAIWYSVVTLLLNCDQGGFPMYTTQRRQGKELIKIKVRKRLYSYAGKHKIEVE